MPLRDRLLRLLAGALAWLLLSASAPAQEAVLPPVPAQAWILVDAWSGKILAERQAQARMEPASLTKIMTAYLIFEALREQRLRLDQRVTVSPRARDIDPASSKMFLEAGQEVSIHDLLRGLLVQSGNDAAIVLAEAEAGSIAAFVDKMNRRAEAMGMTGTHFASPHGLSDPATYSTAQDLAVLARRLIADFPAYHETYDSIREFTYNKIRQTNRNRLLWIDPTVDGLKTGHTRSAGYCLVASAQRPGASVRRRLIAVVLGAASDQDRTEASQALLNWGFENFETLRLYRAGQAVASQHVWKGDRDQVRLGVAHDVYVSVPKSVRISGAPRIALHEPIVAPVAQHARVGVLQEEVGGQWVETPLVALESVASAGWFGRLWDGLALWMSTAWAAIFEPDAAPR